MRFSLPAFFITWLYLCACKSEPNFARRAIKADTASLKQQHINYVKCKDSIAGIRKKMRKEWNSHTLEQKQQIFTHSVTDLLIPAWMGTAWDFNGTTEQPGKGYIACGYFVTTVLRDAGISLNRVKLARCASSEMIRKLVSRKHIRSFYGNAYGEFYHYLSVNKFGLYIVGLDNHTGFIYHDGKETWFIHSSFIGCRCVQKEKVSESWLLKSSKCHVLGKLSADKDMLDLWVN